MDTIPTHGPPSAAGLTADQRPAARYAALWTGGRPDLDAFLAANGPLAADEFAAVLRADQRCRWRSGDRVPAEHYLGRLPGSPPDPEAVADLIFNEFLVREQLGERPDPREYEGRFPDYAAMLRDQIDLHRALTAESLPFDDGHPDTLSPAFPPAQTTGPRLLPDDRGELGRSFGDYELLGVVFG